MNLIESSFDVTTAKRASAHPVFNVSYPGYVVFIIYATSQDYGHGRDSRHESVPVVRKPGSEPQRCWCRPWNKEAF